MIKIAKKNIDLDDLEILKIISNILKSNKVATMATSNKDIPWVHAFFYNFDKDLNLYFLSSSKTRHGLNINTNSIVAVSIFDTTQDPKIKNKIGLFIEGKCIELTSPKDVLTCLTNYGKRFLGSIIDNEDVKEMLSDARNSGCYKFTPTYIKVMVPEAGTKKTIEVFLK